MELKLRDVGSGVGEVAAGWDSDPKDIYGLGLKYKSRVYVYVRLNLCGISYTSKG